MSQRTKKKAATAASSGAKSAKKAKAVPASKKKASSSKTKPAGKKRAASKAAGPPRAPAKKKVPKTAVFYLLHGYRQERPPRSLSNNRCCDEPGGAL